MKTLAALTAAMALGACAALSSTFAPTQHQTEIARGQAFAREHCAACHAIGATGESPAEAAPAFRDIRDRFDAHSLGGFISQGVSFTHPRMPAFEVSENDTKALAAYLRSVQQEEQRRIQDDGTPPPARRSHLSAKPPR